MNRMVLDPLVATTLRDGSRTARAIEVLAPMLNVDGSPEEEARLGEQLSDNPGAVGAPAGFSVPQSPLPALMIGDPRVRQRTILEALRRHGAVPLDVDDDWAGHGQRSDE